MSKIVVIVVVVFVVASLDVVGSVDAEDDVSKVVAEINVSLKSFS